MSKFQAVLVYRLDRLGRSLLVVVVAHDRLEGLSVSLRSATESIETATPSGRLIFQMPASFAEYERAAIGEQTRAGLTVGKRTGRRHRNPYNPPLRVTGRRLWRGFVCGYFNERQGVVYTRHNSSDAHGDGGEVALE